LYFVKGGIRGGILIEVIMTLVVRVVRMEFLDCCGHLEEVLARKYIQGSLNPSSAFPKTKTAARMAMGSGVNEKDSRLDF
jgi:hypothetical protein